METIEIIDRVLKSESLPVFKKKSEDDQFYKQVKKYLLDIKMSENDRKNKVSIWKKSADLIEKNSIIFNILTDSSNYDAMSYFHKFHSDHTYHVFNGEHSSYILSTDGEFFHWTDCYKNIKSHRGFSSDALLESLNSIEDKSKIKLIHLGRVNYEETKYILSSLDSIIKTYNPYILFEEFLVPYDVEENYAKYSIKKKKLNLFETKSFKAFKDYSNKNSISFDVVCSMLPNDGLVLLKIKASQQ
jgi:hypothetical protein